MLLEACRVHGTRASSSPPRTRPTAARASCPTARTSRSPRPSPTTCPKAAADLIARSYWHTFGLPVAVTRFANLYGGGDTNRSRLVPEAVGAALSGRAPVIRSDGSPERDFLYVEDAVAAYLAHLAGAAGGATAAARRSTPAAAAHTASARWSISSAAWPGAAWRPGSVALERPHGEIDRQWVDATRLSQLTGWAPAVGLEDGLRRTIAWYREHPRRSAWAGPKYNPLTCPVIPNGHPSSTRRRSSTSAAASTSPS